MSHIPPQILEAFHPQLFEALQHFEVQGSASASQHHFLPTWSIELLARSAGIESLHRKSGESSVNLLTEWHIKGIRVLGYSLQFPSLPAPSWHKTERLAPFCGIMNDMQNQGHLRHLLPHLWFSSYAVTNKSMSKRHHNHYSVTTPLRIVGSCSNQLVNSLGQNLASHLTSIQK